jgi:hypothetical protein
MSTVVNTTSIIPKTSSATTVSLPQFFDTSFWDRSVTPAVKAAGYQLFTYVSGSSTPKVTWTSGAGNVENTNPIILNADGGCNLFLQDGASYDFELRRPVSLGSGLVQRFESVFSSGPGESKFVNWIRNALNTITRTVSDKLSDITSLNDFSLAGNGIADDYAGIQAALGTGNNVYIPEGKTYRYTQPLLMTTSHQRFYGPGILKPEGNIDGVRITGGCVGAEVDLTFNAPLHTGTAVRVDNADRVRIKKIHGIDVGSVLHVQRSNSTTVDWIWAIARSKGITWYGTDAIRSDILRINSAVINCAPNEYGFDWDGNCHSLSIGYLGLVTCKGAIIRNTSGGTTFPAIGKFNHIEVDFSTSHGIEILAGLDYDFSMPYLQGCTGSGMKIGSLINAYEVRVNGGKSIGNARYGIENEGGLLQFGMTTALYSNTLGETSGIVAGKAVRIQFDELSYVLSNTAGTVQAYDVNDATTYTRTTDTLTDTINNLPIFSRDPSRTRSYVPHKLQSYLVSALPVTTIAGDTAYATNGRKQGESVGSGTGVLVFSDGSGWKSCDQATPVVA